MSRLSVLISHRCTTKLSSRLPGALRENRWRLARYDPEILETVVTQMTWVAFDPVAYSIASLRA